MQARPDSGAKGEILDALDTAGFGLLVLNRDLRLCAVTGPVLALLPDLQGRLVPGSDWNDLVRLPDLPSGAVDVSALIWGKTVAISAERLGDGRVLLTVRAKAGGHDEPQLSHVIEGGTVGTWEWDVTTGQLRVNDRWITMLGHTRGSIGPVSFDTMTRLLHPGDRARLAESLEQQVAQKVESFAKTFRLRHTDGSWVWVQSRGRILRWSADGKPQLMAGVHLDITVQKSFEQRLEHVLEGAQVGTWQFDETTREIQINARWAEMLGYTFEEITSRKGNFFADLLHPDDVAQLMAEQDGRMRTGSWTFDNEFRLAHKDGHWVWILSRGRVTEWSDDGQPLLTSGVHIDISERKALADALERERDFLACLMDTSISGIVALDAEGRIIFANREAETVLGRSHAFLMGKTCYDADWGMTGADGRRLGREMTPFHDALTLGEVQRGIRLGLVWPDGSPRQVLVNAAPVERAGIAARVVCSVVDITETVAAEANLRAAMERAEAGNRAKSVFLANMSHEIRTPLNGVLGMADVLGATLSTPEQQAMLQTIQQSGAHLLAILNDILDLAKIESGRMSLERLEFLPAQLAQRIEAVHGVGAQAKGIDLQVLCDSGAQQARLGDPQRVLQVLHNLTGNAVKFTEAGVVRVVMTARPGGPLVLDVSDTGIGMTSAQSETVFQDFVQADSTITRRFGGTGLGLPIVRNLVTLMEGTLTLDSAPGRGTRVRVELPLPPVPATPARAPRPSQNLARLRALVAEDNATNRVILRSMLASLGMSFTLVEDGDQAVAVWAPDLFDILLLDISMPRRDGVSALHTIRGRAAAAGVSCPPALAVTANAMTHHVAEYAKAGFAGCVAKPVRLDDLAAAIAQAVAESEPG